MKMNIQLQAPGIGVCHHFERNGLTDGRLSIKSNGETYRLDIHKDILSNGSPFFDHQFKYEGEKPFYLIKGEIEPILLLIKYMYGCSTNFSIEDVVILANYSDYFQMTQFISQLIDTVQDGFRSENYPLYLAISILDGIQDINSFTDLYTFLLDRLILNFSLVKDDLITDASIDTLYRLLSSDYLNINSENELLPFLQEWRQLHPGSDGDLNDLIIPILRLASINSWGREGDSHIYLDSELSTLPNFINNVEEFRTYQPDNRIYLPNDRNIPRVSVAQRSLTQSDFMFSYGLVLQFYRCNENEAQIRVWTGNQMKHIRTDDCQSILKIGEGSVIRYPKTNNEFTSKIQVVYGRTPECFWKSIYLHSLTITG